VIRRRQKNAAIANVGCKPKKAKEKIGTFELTCLIALLVYRSRANGRQIVSTFCGAGVSPAKGSRDGCTTITAVVRTSA
jgi:hypothetical protein